MVTSAQTSSESYLSMFDDIWNALPVHPLSLDYCLHLKVYAAVDELVDLNSLLREIDKAQWRAVVEPFRHYNYDYWSGKRTVRFSWTVRDEYETYVTALPSVDRVKLPKESYRIVLLDERYMRRSTEVG